MQWEYQQSREKLQKSQLAILETSVCPRYTIEAMGHFLYLYKYTFAFFFSLLLAIVLFLTGTLDHFLTALDGFAYLSVAVAGFLFSFSIAAPIASLYFVELGQHLNPYAIVGIGALGAMLADTIMYRYLKDGIMPELSRIAKAVVTPSHRRRFTMLLHRRFFYWMIFLLAAALIASPLPDETGLALFSIINFRPKYLSALSLFLNAIGIAALVFIGYELA